MLLVAVAGLLLLQGPALAARTSLGSIAVAAGGEAAAAQPGGRQLLSEKDHKYKRDDTVPLWASKVGPFTNPR